MTSYQPLANLANGSQTGLANATRTSESDALAPVSPTYGTYETDGERTCERADLTEVNAHDTRPRTLAYETPCRYCSERIYVALCRDGRWRSFDLPTYPAAPTCIWSWRRGHGMEEQDLVPGKRLHYCAHHDRPNLAPWDR